MNPRTIRIAIIVSIIALLGSMFALILSFRLEAKINNATCLAKFQACDAECLTTLESERNRVIIARSQANNRFVFAMNICRAESNPLLRQQCEREAGEAFVAELDALDRQNARATDAYRFCRLDCAKEGAECQQRADIRVGIPIRIPGNLQDLDGDGKLDMMPVDEICKRIGGGVCADCYRSFCPNMDVALRGDKKDFLILLINLNRLTGAQTEIGRFPAKDGTVNIILKEVPKLAPEDVLGFQFLNADGSVADGLRFEVLDK